MSTIFTEYPEIPEVELGQNNETAKKSVREKKMKKRLKELDERLYRLTELYLLQEEESIKNANTKKDSFISKLGDAFVKATPSIFTVIATGLIGSYFKSKKH